MVRLVDERRQQRVRVSCQQIPHGCQREGLDGGDHDRGVQGAFALHQQTHFETFPSEGQGQLPHQILAMYQGQDAPVGLL